MSDDHETQAKVYGPRFAIVPDQVLFADVTATAKLLWAVLARYADPMGHCYPGRRRLAELLGCSIPTIARAKAELIKAKLIECHERYGEGGRRTSDDVFLIGGCITSDPPRIKNDTGVRIKNDTAELEPERSNPTPYGVGSGVTSVENPPPIKIAPPCTECLERPGLLLIGATVDQRTFESSGGHLLCEHCYAQADPDEYEAIRQPLTDADRQRGKRRIGDIRESLHSAKEDPWK